MRHINYYRLSISGKYILATTSFFNKNTLRHLIFETILALEAAVIAVSDPDKKPETRIKIIIVSNKNKLKIFIYIMLTILLFF